VHVSVDSFMNSPRYDEIVELLQQANDPQAAALSTAPIDGTGSAGSGNDLLSRDSIDLRGTGGRAEAITRAGELLVVAGAVDASYVEAMHEREGSVSTYMGNLLAIPHGTNEAKSSIRHSAISFVRDADGVAEVFLDEDRVVQLERATTPDDVLRVLGQVQPA